MRRGFSPGDPLPPHGTGTTPTPGQPPATASDLSPTVQLDLAKHPDAVWRLVEHMLIEGSTFEEAVDEAARQGAKITAAEVEAFFRNNPRLQRKRVKRLVQNSARLARALGGPNKAEKALARAAILTGLQRLRSEDAELTMKDALKARMDYTNVSLKRQLLYSRRKLAWVREDLDKAHLQVVKARAELVRLQAGRLRRVLDSLEHKPNLPVDAVKKIHEIYGLVAQQTKQQDVDQQWGELPVDDGGSGVGEG